MVSGAKSERREVQAQADPLSTTSENQSAC
jgi:hypothetical protein